MVVSDTQRPFSSVIVPISLFFFDGTMIDLISLSLGVYPIRFVTNRLSCIQTYQSDYNSNDIGIEEGVNFPHCCAGPSQSHLAEQTSRSNSIPTHRFVMSKPIVLVSYCPSIRSLRLIRLTGHWRNRLRRYPCYYPASPARVYRESVSMSLLLTETSSNTITKAVRKASKLHAIFPNAPAPQLEVIELPSLVSDYTETVKGIGALIHSASPSYIAGETGEEIIEVRFLRRFVFCVAD
jgi:hypothetical protein